MAEYIDQLIEILEVRNEVMAELEEGLPLCVAGDHDEHFGADVTNKVVVAAMEVEAERRLAERERDRRRARLS